MICIAFMFPLLALASSRFMESEGDRIVGGQVWNPAASDEAYTRSYIKIDIDGTYACGGVLYDDSKIVTSANCLKGVTDPSRITAYTLALAPSGSGTMLTTLQVDVHPSFNPLSTTVKLPYDLAVIHISESLAGLPPAPTCTTQDCGGDGVGTRTVGLGATDASGSPLATQTWRRNMNLAKGDAESEWGNAFDGTIQIGANAIDDTDGPCTMDEGGPLFRRSNGQLCGVLSYFLVPTSNMGCNLTRSVVFTNLCNDTIQSWINSAAVTTTTTPTTTTQTTTTTPTTTTPTTTTPTTTTTATTTTATTTLPDCTAIQCITGSFPFPNCNCPSGTG